MNLLRKCHPCYESINNKMNSKIIISFLIFWFTSFSVTHAQCEGDAFFDSCMAKIKTYTFLKAFNTKIKKSKKGKDRIEKHSYVMSKGTSYVLTACSGTDSDAKIIVTLEDGNHRPLASTYIDKTKKYYPAIGYSCQATGIHYIIFTYDKDLADGCGVSLLAFKKVQ